MHCSHLLIAFHGTQIFPIGASSFAEASSCFTPNASALRPPRLAPLTNTCRAVQEPEVQSTVTALVSPEGQ